MIPFSSCCRLLVTWHRREDMERKPAFRPWLACNQQSTNWLLALALKYRLPFLCISAVDYNMLLWFPLQRQKHSLCGISETSISFLIWPPLNPWGHMIACMDVLHCGLSVCQYWPFIGSLTVIHLWQSWAFYLFYSWGCQPLKPVSRRTKKAANSPEEISWLAPESYPSVPIFYPWKPRNFSGFGNKNG